MEYTPEELEYVRQYEQKFNTRILSREERFAKYLGMTGEIRYLYKRKFQEDLARRYRKSCTSGHCDDPAWTWQNKLFEEDLELIIQIEQEEAD
jgi:hypothetical protein